MVTSQDSLKIAVIIGIMLEIYKCLSENDCSDPEGEHFEDCLNVFWQHLMLKYLNISKLQSWENWAKFAYEKM